MWQDDVIFALDQDGGEHEIQYSDIERYSESTITEKSIKCTNKKGHSWKEIDTDGTVECEHCGLRNSLSESTITEEYVESMNHIELDEYLNAIGELWNDWKNGPMTEPSDIRPAQKELKGFIEGWFKKTIR
jgi:hypothetical protein